MYVASIENSDSWSARGTVRKFAASGKPIWTRTLTVNGRRYWTSADVVAVSATTVFVGWTVGIERISRSRAYVSAFTLDGRRIWTVPVTRATPGYSSVGAIATTADGGIAVGVTVDADEDFTRSYGQLKRLSATGSTRWTRTLQSGKGEVVHEVTFASNGDIVVAGWTNGNLRPFASAGKADAFVARYEPSGAELWLVQFGTDGNDRAAALAARPGALLIGGRSFQGSGTNNMWVRQLSDEGDVAWETTFGNRSALPSDFVLTAINLRSDGSMLVTGSTTGTLSDSSNASAGRIDMFLRSINAEGDTEWTEMLGTAEDDLLLDAKFLPGSNRLAIVGTTKGSIGAEPYKGGWDTFLGVLADAA